MSWVNLEPLYTVILLVRVGERPELKPDRSRSWVTEGLVTVVTCWWSPECCRHQRELF